MNSPTTRQKASLKVSKSKSTFNRLVELGGRTFLFTVTSMSLLAVLFIFYFIAKDAFPFFKEQGFVEFFTSTRWYPAAEKAEYGALSIFYGTAMVTLGACVVAVPLGIAASVCLSDVLPFSVRQFVKPVIEILAAIPSVAYGFFALVVLAPALQNNGGNILAVVFWFIFLPIALITALTGGELIADRAPEAKRKQVTLLSVGTLMVLLIGLIYYTGTKISNIEVTSGTNALNVSFILGLMALPTIVSVAEDALQACGRELREGSYALGATRAETLVKVVLPASMSGIIAAIILGVMRAVGETMVVWMASGNTAKIPEPWYNVLSPVRTLTASIAGDMGEAARNTQRYHVLFAMALSLLVVSFTMNWLSQWVVNRQRRKLGK